jgi:hypothetical protein
LHAPAFVPSNESTSIGNDSENTSDDNFDDDFGYNSPCSGSDLSDSSGPVVDIPPLIPVDTDSSGASDMSFYITDIKFEDPDTSSEGKWIECLVHNLKRPENCKNFSVDSLPKQLQVNYTSIKGNRQLPASADSGVGLDIHSLERNTTRVKMPDWVCPKPVIVVVYINRQPCCALFDSGSLSDFMSTTLADQHKVKLKLLDKPLPLQLAVSSS